MRLEPPADKTADKKSRLLGLALERRDLPARWKSQQPQKLRAQAPSLSHSRQALEENGIG
jgi:hypothetical protein